MSRFFLGYFLFTFVVVLGGGSLQRAFWILRNKRHKHDPISPTRKEKNYTAKNKQTKQADKNMEGIRSACPLSLACGKGSVKIDWVAPFAFV